MFYLLFPRNKIKKKDASYMKINHVDFKVDLLILARTTKYEFFLEKSKPRCYMKFHENTNQLSVHDKESFKRFSHKLTYYKSYCPD